MDGEFGCGAGPAGVPDSEGRAELGAGSAAATAGVAPAATALALFPAAVPLRLVQPDPGLLAPAAGGLGILAIATKVTALLGAAAQSWAHSVKSAHVPVD